MTETPAGKRLHVLKAVEDGWSAFARAPWPFVLFALLYGVLAILFQLLPEFLLDITTNPSVSAAVISLIVSMVGSVLISLWGTMGLIRGAWKALDGEKLGFSTMTRWDGDAAGRLFINQIVLIILGLIISGISLALMVALSQANEVLGYIPFITAAVVFIYLMVNQTFLPFLALLEDESPLSNLRRGQGGGGSSLGMGAAAADRGDGDSVDRCGVVRSGPARCLPSDAVCVNGGLPATV